MISRIFFFNERLVFLLFIVPPKRLNPCKFRLRFNNIFYLRISGSSSEEQSKPEIERSDQVEKVSGSEENVQALPQSSATPEAATTPAEEAMEVENSVESSTSETSSTITPSVVVEEVKDVPVSEQVLDDDDGNINHDMPMTTVTPSSTSENDATTENNSNSVRVEDSNEATASTTSDQPLSQGAAQVTTPDAAKEAPTKDIDAEEQVNSSCEAVSKPPSTEDTNEPGSTEETTSEAAVESTD